MSRATILLFLLLASAEALAQNVLPGAAKEAPQTARQAMLEAFFGDTPDHMEKHLPEITRKAFKQLDTGSGSLSILTQISMMGMEIKRGSRNFQTFETGPILLLAEDMGGSQKVEVYVERDDLAGDEDVVELSFHLYKQGKEEGLPIVPRLAFSLRTEANVWRVYDARLTLSAPVGDPDFLKTLVKHLLEDQQNRNEMWATTSLRAIATAETAYRSNSPNRAFTCTLSQLAQPIKVEAEEAQGGPIDQELATGKKNGYVFALTGCDGLHFKAAAEPATSAAGRHAFCVDESGTIRISKDGKATTCLSTGEECQRAWPGVER